MSIKKRAIVWAKRTGNERLEYWIVDSQGCIKSCSPAAWHRIDLPDETTAGTLETAAKLRYIANTTQFNQRVDDNRALREAGQLESPTRYQWLCKHRNVTF